MTVTSEHSETTYTADHIDAPTGMRDYIREAVALLRRGRQVLASRIVPTCPEVLTDNLQRFVDGIARLLDLRAADAEEQRNTKAELRAAHIPGRLARTTWYVFMAIALISDGLGALALATASLVPGKFILAVTVGIALIPLAIGWLTGISVRGAHDAERGSRTSFIFGMMAVLGTLTACAYALGGILARFELAFGMALFGRELPLGTAIALSVTAVLGLACSFLAEWGSESWTVTRLTQRIASLGERIKDLDHKIIAMKPRLASAIDQLAPYMKVLVERGDTVVSARSTASGESPTPARVTRTLQAPDTRTESESDQTNGIREQDHSDVGSEKLWAV
jgi:hypothetical protein